MIPLMWKSKVDTNEFMKEKHRHRKQTYGYQRGRRWGRDKLGVRFLANTNYYISNR